MMPATMVAGTPPDSAGGCSPSRPVPVIAFQGTAHPLGGNDGGYMDGDSILTWLLKVAPNPRTYVPPATVWMSGWAQRNGYNMTPEVLPVQGDTSGIRYMGCKDNAAVILGLAAHRFSPGQDQHGYQCERTHVEIL